MNAKRHNLLVFLVVAALFVGGAALCADQGDYEEDFGEAQEEKMGATQMNRTLEDVEFSGLKIRMAELERRLSSLERTERFQDERLRNLQRTVDDVKRREIR